MKLVTKIATIATIASFMFAGVNVTWGNSYDDDGGAVGAATSFGVHFDVNDNTTVGWENGLMIGLAGPAGTTFRLGYEDVPTLGMSYTWWEGAGTGWGTSLSTAVDFGMTGVDGVDDSNDCGTDDDGNPDGSEGACGDGVDAIDAGAFSITVNLGFGF